VSSSIQRRTPSEIREPKLGKREGVCRELTAAELDEVTGAGLFGGIGKAVKSVVKVAAPIAG
jgi:hypothetical protein